MTLHMIPPGPESHGRSLRSTLLEPGPYGKSVVKVPARLVSAMLYPSRPKTQPGPLDTTIASNGAVVPAAPLAANDLVSWDTCPPQSSLTSAVTVSPAAGEST